MKLLERNGEEEEEIEGRDGMIRQEGRRFNR